MRKIWFGIEKPVLDNCFKLLLTVLVSWAILALVTIAGCKFEPLIGGNSKTITDASQLDMGPKILLANIVNPNLQAVHVVGQYAVTLGEGGVIWRSADSGENWTPVFSDTGSWLYDIYSDGDRWVAVGSEGTVVRSTDGGKSWNTVPSGTDQPLNAVHGDGNRWVAVGMEGTIVRPKDGGKTWGEVLSGTDKWLSAVHGDGDRWVAVGLGGTIVRSWDGGKTWEPAISETDKDLWGVYGEGNHWVAVGGDGIIVRSVDGGENWRKVPSDTEQRLTAVYGGKDRWVAVGGDGTIVQSAVGGENWSLIPSGTDQHLTAVHSYDGQWVGVGVYGTVVHFGDGDEIWSPVSDRARASWLDIHGDGDRWVAVGAEGAIERSKDGGETWETIPSDTEQRLWVVHGEGDRWGALAGFWSIARSKDGGETWDTEHSVTDYPLQDIYIDGDRSVAVGEGGEILYSKESDETWSRGASGNDQPLMAVHGDGNRWVAVGKEGTIVRSMDGGETWLPASSRTDSSLWDIHNDGDRWVAVGDGGTIVHSRDGGENWDPLSSGTDSSLSDIHNDGDRWVAVGDGGTIVRSRDLGETWLPVLSGTDQSLESVYGYDDQWMAVGDEGAIVYSADGGETWSRVSSNTDLALLGVYGNGLRWFTTGLEESGETTILLVKPSEVSFPLLEKIDHRPTLNPGELKLFFKVQDPDNVCEAPCRLHVRGGSDNDLARNRAFEKLDAERVSKKDSSLWTVTLNPERDLRVLPGEDLHLLVTFAGPFFSMRYPIDDETISVKYLTDYTLYYVAAFVVSVVSVLLIIFWLKPLWMLSLYRRAKIFEFLEKIPVPGIAESMHWLSNVLLVPWLVHRPRVLNAWLAEHRVRFVALFEGETVVRNLRYYPLPIRRPAIDDRIHTPSPDRFQGELKNRRSIIQIIGPGGAGKTSLAAQLCKWGMDGLLAPNPIFPVWMDEEITDLGDTVVNRIRKVSADDGLPESFIHAMFRRKRIRVVVDRLSEKSEATQVAVQNPPDYLSALMITSRKEHAFGLPEANTVEVVPLRSEHLMGFINDLLRNATLDYSKLYQGFKRQVMLARRFSDAISIGEKELPVTPLLVKLFVGQALEQARLSGDYDLNGLPKSVPEVYFSYLRAVNPDDKAAANYLPSQLMMEVAKIVAREELGDDFRPKGIDKEVLRKLLKEAGFFETGDPIQRLLDNQVLQEKEIGGSSIIMFALDPIAEYVAAFSYAQECGNSEQCWTRLWARVKRQAGNSEGFEEALLVTHEVYSRQLGWPEFQKD